MPPLKTYIFKHKKSSVIAITLEIYGGEDKAWSILSRYVDIIKICRYFRMGINLII